MSANSARKQTYSSWLGRFAFLAGVFIIVLFGVPCIVKLIFPHAAGGLQGLILLPFLVAASWIVHGLTIYFVVLHGIETRGRNYYNH